MSDPIKDDNALPARSKVEPPSHLKEKTILELMFPILCSGVKTTHVTIRRPKFRDRRAIAATNLSETDREIQLFCRLTDLQPDDLDQLDDADYRRMVKEVEGFLPPDMRN